MQNKQMPIDLHLGSHCSFIHQISFGSLSVALPLLMPVYFNLQSMQVMYLRKYWAVSYLSHLRNLDQLEKELKVLSVLQVQLTQVTGHLIEKVSKERDLKPCLRLLTEMLISAGHCLGQQLLHSVFHHIWPFLWNIWNGVAHIFGQVRIFFYFYNLGLFFFFYQKRLQLVKYDNSMAHCPEKCESQLKGGSLKD